MSTAAAEPVQDNAVFKRMDSTQPYLQFFGLREQPFAPTADPAYFYAARGHKECLLRLWNSIDERHGIAIVLGNYGTGKTTLLRKLISSMYDQPERYRTAVVGSPIPSWTSFALLESIVAQFGLKPAGYTFANYIEALNQYLLNHRASVCTLIIDDAQNLNKRGQLELLRLVQNLETQQHKLLNLVLFAQMEWLSVLQAAPNFAQRVNVTYTLDPLALDEIGSFVEYRIERACEDMQLAPRFEDEALRAIYVYAEGSPRVIVTLCRNALMVAARLSSRRVTRDMVLHTIEKTTLPNPEKRSRLLESLGLTEPATTPEPPRAAFAPAPEAMQEPSMTPRENARPLTASQPPYVESPRPGASNDARAAQLLLRAAREKQRRDPESR